MRFTDVLDAIRHATALCKRVGKDAFIVERDGYVQVKNRRAVTDFDRVLEIVRA